MSSGQVENYVLLLVLLSVFAGGTLVLLSLLLLFCHRCCMGGRRYSRCEAASATQTRILRPSVCVCVFKTGDFCASVQGQRRPGEDKHHLRRRLSAHSR